VVLSFPEAFTAAREFLAEKFAAKAAATSAEASTGKPA